MNSSARQAAIREAYNASMTLQPMHGRNMMKFVCSLSRGRIRGERRQLQPLILASVGGATVLLAAVLLAVPAQAAHETPQEREAWYLVKQRCYLCHFIDNQDVRWGTKWGPSLKDLFKRQNGKLMNDKPINDQTVSDWIVEGSPNMPSFKYTLNQRQIQLIITYLKGGFPTAPRQDGTYLKTATSDK